MSGTVYPFSSSSGPAPGPIAAETAPTEAEEPSRGRNGRGRRGRRGGRSREESVSTVEVTVETDPADQGAELGSDALPVVVEPPADEISPLGYAAIGGVAGGVLGAAFKIPGGAFFWGLAGAALGYYIPRMREGRKSGNKGV